MCFAFNIYSFSSSQVVQGSFSIGYLTFSSHLNLRTKVEYNEYRVSTGEHLETNSFFYLYSYVFQAKCISYIKFKGILGTTLGTSPPQAVACDDRHRFPEKRSNSLIFPIIND